MADAKLHYFF